MFHKGEPCVLPFLMSFLTFVGVDCCLDVEWLSEDTFASAGADMRIFVMQINKNDPIKTFRSVCVFDFMQAKTNNAFWTG